MVFFFKEKNFKGCLIEFLSSLDRKGFFFFSYSYALIYSLLKYMIANLQCASATVWINLIRFK